MAMLLSESNKRCWTPEIACTRLRTGNSMERGSTASFPHTVSVANVFLRELSEVNSQRNEKHSLDSVLQFSKCPENASFIIVSPDYRKMHQ